MSIQIIAGSGNNAFELHVKALSPNLKRGIRQAFYFAGKDFKKTASDEILRKKTGNVYFIYGGKRRRKYTASEAGDYPANRSGANRRSLNFEVRGSDELEFGAQMPYSPFLELGTRKMAARPFLKPSIAKNEQNLRTHLSREIAKAIKQ